MAATSRIMRCEQTSIANLRLNQISFDSGATRGRVGSVMNQSHPLPRDMEGFVYIIRNEDLYKIGHTDDLERRLRELKPTEAIAHLRSTETRKI